MRHSLSVLLARVRGWLIRNLACYLATPVVHGRLSGDLDAEALSAMLRLGDVLLTEGNTRMAAVVRRVTGSAWAHVAIYVGPRSEGPDPLCIVEADMAAGVRAVPLSDLNGQRVRVLRPAGLNDTDIRRVTEWIVNRIGAAYDMAHAWTLAKRFLGLPSRMRPAADTTAQDAARFICSSLLAQAFILAGYPIAPTQVGLHDGATADHQYVTPQDFESASVFEVVR